MQEEPTYGTLDPIADIARGLNSVYEEWTEAGKELPNIHKCGGYLWWVIQCVEGDLCEMDFYLIGKHMAGVPFKWLPYAIKQNLLAMVKQGGVEVSIGGGHGVRSYYRLAGRVVRAGARYRRPDKIYRDVGEFLKE